MDSMPASQSGETNMDEETRARLGAFAMGTVGAPPVGADAAEERDSQDGFRASRALAQYGVSIDVLAAVANEHPELGIMEVVTDVIRRLEAGEEIGPVLASLEPVLERARPYLPA